MVSNFMEPAAVGHKGEWVMAGWLPLLQNAEWCLTAVGDGRCNLNHDASSFNIIRPSLEANCRTARQLPDQIC